MSLLVVVVYSFCLVLNTAIEDLYTPVGKCLSRICKSVSTNQRVAARKGTRVHRYDAQWRRPPEASQPRRCVAAQGATGCGGERPARLVPRQCVRLCVEVL